MLHANFFMSCALARLQFRWWQLKYFGGIFTPILEGKDEPNFDDCAYFSNGLSNFQPPSSYIFGEFGWQPFSPSIYFPERSRLEGPKINPGKKTCNFWVSMLVFWGVTLKNVSSSAGFWFNLCHFPGVNCTLTCGGEQNEKIGQEGVRRIWVEATAILLPEVGVENPWFHPTLRGKQHSWLENETLWMKMHFLLKINMCLEKF